ncbi:DUF4384 domain-containing protein [Flavobacteriales bacterium]|nr:DUF4384 domain-containing protein [Flavobacteriales bacterium]
MKFNLITLLFFMSYFCFGQHVEVSQKVYISDNDTYNSALKMGLDAAKSEALTKAGVTEHLSEYTRLFTSEINDNITEVFNSDLLIHLGGTIQQWDYKTKPEKKYDSLRDSYYIEFEIWAKVKKYKSKPDPTFKARVSGLETSYRDKDRIEFSVYPFQDCYLTVFYISEKQAHIVFPYNLEQKTFIQGNTKMVIDYLEASADFEFEHGRIISVITSELNPFEFTKFNEDGYLINTSVEDVFKWILTIEPSDRKEYYHQFVITK